MAECNHDCGSCNKEDCGIRKAPMNPKSNVKKVIGVVSGKGGVGKSSVTSMLAVLAMRMGKKVAILDADVTGPSIPTAFGLTEKALGNEEEIMPVITKTGIKTISVNSLLEDETDPVVWRGPVVGGVVEQFWSNVVWEDIDVMLVDMPPGTGDVALTVYQSLPVDGIVIVTSPQQLVGVIVEKAVKMAKMLDIPVLGIVENMSYFKCDECGKEHKIFGDSHIEEIASRYGVDKVAKIPMDPMLAARCDSGLIEFFEGDFLDELAKEIL
ncbi:MAG: Mrp/NBP35 family ATP-binding protein [Clostridia bacterium]|nr:Mrp/NBP35 family ATP-binding protein [Clostridia bacterium]